MMTCDELDNLRDRGALNAESSVVGEHLRTCVRCQRFQEVWNAPPKIPDVPQEVEQRISRYILGALKPVSTLPSNGAIVASLTAVALIAMAVGTWILGNNGFEKMANWQAWAMFASIGIGLLVAAYCVALQMIPGALERLPLARSIGTVTALLIAAILILFPYAPDPSFVTRGLRCWEIGMISGAGAAVLLTIVLRRSARVNEAKLYTASAFLSGLAGFGVLEVFCPILDRAHISVWHIGSALSFTLIGGLIGLASNRMAKRPGFLLQQAAKS